MKPAMMGWQWHQLDHSFWPTVLSVEPMVQCVVCLSVCDVLYCGKMVRPSQKVSQGVNRKPGSKSSFFGHRHISTSGFGSTATETAVSCLMYCGEMVRPIEKLSEGVNRKPGSKS